MEAKKWVTSLWEVLSYFEFLSSCMISHNVFVIIVSEEVVRCNRVKLSSESRVL